MEMNICKNGHYYDADRYEHCPECGGAVTDAAGPKLYDDERTVSGFAEGRTEKPKTATEDFVVGWLVEVSGAKTGTAYPLKSGVNLIGRSEDMDICLAGEIRVSRERHAAVTYNAESKSFFAEMPRGSKRIFYVNDEPVMLSRQLTRWDRLQVGDVALLFVPLCGADFSWE